MSFELPPSGTRGSEIPRPMRSVMRAMTGVGNLMFRRGMKVQGRPLLRLSTIGAKTGQTRKAVLGWFPDEDMEKSWLVVGSNGGSARHPAWAYNLASHPDRASIELRGDGTLPVTATLVTGTGRAEAWSRITAMSPGYGAYETKTDREIPIFRLTALD